MNQNKLQIRKAGKCHKHHKIQKNSIIFYQLTVYTRLYYLTDSGSTILLTYLLSCVLTYLLSYLLTFLLTYSLSYLRTFLLTYFLTYLLIYLLTPWSRVLLEKLTGSAASQEIPRIF